MPKNNSQMTLFQPTVHLVALEWSEIDAEKAFFSPIITIIANSWSLPMLVLQLSLHIFPSFPHALICWDPAIGYFCPVFENRPKYSRATRGGMEFCNEKMADQVFRHPYSLYFQLWWILFWFWPQKFRIGCKNFLEVSDFISAHISALLDYFMTQ